VGLKTHGFFVYVLLILLEVFFNQEEIVMKIVTTLLFVLIFALSAASTAQAQAFRINNFTITPDIVDIRDGVPQPITITANISTTYNLPTARYGISFIFSDGNETLIAVSLQEVSVSANDKTYQGIVNIPANAYSRTWRIVGIDISDDSGNHISLNTAILTALGFKTSFQVMGASAPPIPKSRKRVRFF
jgi:hypothetical protein